jgi:hypothetical protein
MTTTVREQASGEVIAWRREQLMRAGFSRATARSVARDGRFDLHALLELVDHGCPPGLAVRIVAPLDEEPRA